MFANKRIPFGENGNGGLENFGDEGRQSLWKFPGNTITERFVGPKVDRIIIKFHILCLLVKSRVSLSMIEDI